MAARPFLKGALHLPSLIQALYKTVLQPALFSADPEAAHEWSANRIRGLKNWPFVLSWMERALSVRDSRLEVSIGGKTAPNPVGLGAGFDKGGDLFPSLSRFGFGFIEAGTFTPKPQPGNEKPRLFRFKNQRALVNRMGFNNPGAGVLADRFKDWSGSIPIGVNIGKGKPTPPEKAVDDYRTAFEAAFPFADYVTINVSSPNTPNLRDLQAVDSLRDIVGAVESVNKTLSEKTGRKEVQIYVKVAPDLADESLQDITRMALDKKIGLIATNTTINHESIQREGDQAGGLSGAPLKDRADDVLKGIFQLTKGTIPLMGVGGILSADDAYEKICLGADAVQIYTGWIYEGPDLVPRINRGLLSLMERDGIKTIKEAVGTKAR